MGVNEREKIQYELLEALYKARKEVEYLEAALAHNAAFLGTGVEREEPLHTTASGNEQLPGALLRYLGLVEQEEDISNFIGREGHDESRPRLGADAPPEVQPDTEPRVDRRLVSALAFSHPTDGITFIPGAAVASEDSPGVAAASDVPPGVATASDVPPGVAAALDVPPGVAAALDVPPAGVVLPAEPTPASQPAPPSHSPQPSVLPPSVAPALHTAEEDACRRAYLAVQAINDGIWDWNVCTGEVYTSPRWNESVLTLENTGEPTDPVTALAGSMHPEERAKVIEHFQALLEGRAENVYLHVRFDRHQGWGWGILRAVPFVENGRVTRITAVLSDITALREAQCALLESDERYRTLAEDSPDIIARFDRDSRFIYASPNVSRYFTVTPEEVMGRRIERFPIFGATALFQDGLAKVFASGQPVHRELMLSSALAGEFLADCRFWPEFGANGDVNSVSMVIRDMSFARKVAANYYSLFSDMEDGFILFEHVPDWEQGAPRYDADEFVLVLMNPAFAAMFDLKTPGSTNAPGAGEGADAEGIPEAGGVRAAALFKEDAQNWASCFRRVLTGKLPVFDNFRSHNGGQYTISAYSPEPGRVACVVKDTTERQRVEHETRLSEARLAALYSLTHMDSAPEEGVVHFSLDQAVRLTGSAFGYLFLAGREEGESGKVFRSRQLRNFDAAGLSTGQPTGEHTGQPVGEQEAFTGESLKKATEVLLQAGAGGALHAEASGMTQEDFGSLFGEGAGVTRYMLAPVIEDGRVVCMAGVANKQEEYSSSDLRQLELFISGMWFHLRRRWAVQDLRNAKEQAEAANKAKSQFLANISHELRTPLNGVLGMLQVLQQSELDPEQKNCVDTASYSGRSLLRIISDILDFSRIEAGRFTLDQQLFDFSATVRSTLGMFSHQARQNNVRFTVDVAPDIPGLLYGDEARVRQILFNLVGNAFKFTREGDIRVTCSLLPHCPKKRVCIYLGIADTGIGIPQEKIGEIFQAFTQLNVSRTRSPGGTGLGLSIVQRLIELMGGGLSVESEPGAGTVIHCSLSFDPAGPGPLLREEGGGAFSAQGLAAYSMTLLLVEDDPVSLMTLRSLLRKTPHTLFTAENGLVAMEMLLLRDFDAVITDIQMPVMDGTELIRRIREQDTSGITPGSAAREAASVEASAPVKPGIHPALPVIGLTAYAMPGDREAFLGMGMDYYLAKPLNAADLYAVLARVGAIVAARKGE